ncbi:hypothetical protein BLNAU_11193 [Blattamonas nauphoetae]|uniref:Protein kinase domain-containing protein n=1 Tax=Blattamonas nauphoetae TaxID=2049346 RepID=A0ABQ9XNG5_9EUKA|nr:hypothetical protein BLNAU_11193 [Blattamonas nauphoetae]
MMSPNLGGNLVCLNTSFSSCVRQTNDAVLDFSFEHRTPTHINRLDNVTSDVTSVTFILCTFFELTVKTEPGFGGGAIFIELTLSSLTVRTCFFHSCTATGSGDDGGAIRFKCADNYRRPFTVSNSSFTECSATDCAGSVLFVQISFVSMDNCFFDLSTARHDGAVNFESTSVTVSNTAFVDCTSTNRGGALYLDKVTQPILSFVQFRGCTSLNHHYGKDIFSSTSASSVTSDMFTFCDSTSGGPNVYFNGSRTDGSYLVPQISSTLNVKDVTVSFDEDEDEATVTVETEEAIHGTLGLLLDESNVPRLIHVLFGSETKFTNFGTTIVTSGENGLLPETTYSPRKASLSANLFPPRTVTIADSTLKDWNTTDIVLNGFRFEEGDYWMLVKKGGTEWNITLTRSDTETLIGTAPLYPSTADGRLEWGTEYEVAKVMWLPEGEQPEQEIPLTGTITFTTPAEPPRIESVARSLSGKKDLVIVELIGTKFTSSGQTVVISGSSGNISSSGVIFNVTSTQCFVNFSIGSSEDDSHVVFGGQYELLSVGIDSSSFAVNGGLFFTVPHPPRITSIVPQTEVSSSSFLLSVSGENLPSGSTYLITLTSDHTFNILFGSAVAGTATIQIGRSGEVEYDTEYTIKSIIRKEEGKDDEHVLFSATTFRTPLGPTLSLISCPFHSSNPNFLNVSLTTARMPSEDLTLTLKTTQTPIETVSLTITPTDVSTGFILVEVYDKIDTLKYGTEYSVVKMTSSSIVAVVTAQPFSTPAEPIRITAAACSLGGDQQKSALVTLTGVKLGGGKDFKVTVRKMVGSTPTGGEIVLSGTLTGGSSSTTHIHDVVIFGPANPLLSYETKYLITKFTVDGEVSVVNADVTFSVDPEPARIIGLKTRELNNVRTKMIVSLEGRALLSRTGKLSLTNGIKTLEWLSDVVIVDDTNCTTEFTVGNEETSDQLKYGEEYTLKGSWTTSTGFHVEDGITITVPHPPRITSIVPQKEVSTSSFVLSVSGEYLPSGQTFTVTLTSDHTFDILFSSAIAGTATIQIGRSGEVEYDTEYTFKSIIRKEEGKDDEHILFSAATFKTPLGPTLSSISSPFHSSNPNFLNLSLTTARMPSEDFTLTLKTTQTPIESVSFTITPTDVSAGFLLVEVYEQPDTLKYGTEYSVVKMASSSIVAVVTAQPFSTPAEPIRITAAACSLGGDQQKSALVTLTGVKLGGGKDFKVTVRKMVGSTPSGGEIVLSGTLSGGSSSTTHIHDVVIFGPANPLLSYETKYLITKFTVDGEVSVVNADVTFSVDPEPARLTSLESVLQYSPDEKNATIALSGIGMVGEYILTLSVNSSASVNVTLDATFDAEGNGIVTAVLFDLSDPPVVDLSYNTRYEVVGVKQESTPIFYENELVFTTIPVPRRLLSISKSNYVVGMDFVDLSFDSIALPSEATFSLTLESVHSDATTPHRKVIALETDQFGQLTLNRAQLYPFETETEKKKGQLEYGTEYKVVSITESSTLIHFEDVATRIQTPTEPSRIVGVKSRQLNNVRTKMIVSFEGRALSSRSGKVSLTSGSTSLEWLSDVVVNDTHCTAEFAVGSEENSAHMKYGEEYTLKGSWTESTGFHVENGITLVVPFPPKITHMKFVFSNNLHTGCFVTFTGTDLIIGNSLKITLNNSFSFIATVVSESEAKSSELLIGWPETIPYNTVYTLTSVEATKEDDGETIFVGTISDTTGSLPDDFTIFVDSGSTSDSTLFCGDKIRPCCSIEDGWKIVEGVGISSLSISVLCNTTQKEQVRMLLQHQVVIASGPSTKPELFVFPSSTSSELEGEGMIDVSGGRLYIHQVDVALSDSPSLIFIRMVGGHLTVEMCSLVGQSFSPQINVDSITALCEWDTGILTLVDSTTTITSTQLTHLSQGAINMKGGELTVQGAIFSTNTPMESSSFPSLRHNIRCSEGGEIEVGSLNGGDGKADHPHLWLSHDDCLVSGEDVNVNAPFFIPTLSSSSTSTLNKTAKAFQLTIDGAALIPCSLFLEVFEKGKDGKEGQMKPFPLTQDSSSHFNDTTIVFSLPLSSLSSFDDSLEWRGRLAFGNNEISAASFLIQKSAADRIAQAMNENMKWWLPLVASVALMFVIVLVVVLVCCRRRRARKNGTNIEEMKETDQVQMEEEKIEIQTDNRIGVNSIQTFSSSESIKSTEKNEPEPSDDLGDIQNLEEVLPCCGDMKTTVYVSKDRTLYNALHSENRFVIQVRQAQLQLVKGLKGVAKRDREPAILRALTAHNILFDAKQNVCLKLNLNVAPHTPLPNSTQQPQPDHQMPEKEHHQEPTVETNESKPTTLPFSQPANEGVRWYAPEVISNKPHINAGHGAVFSLGLVLWEMETGCVPFGEQDAVNASRQIVTGAKPKMELVQNQEMRELIEQCLSLNPDDRPELDTIEATLTLIPEDRSVHHLTLVQ